MREKGKGVSKGEREVVFVSEDKGLSLDREETHVAHRKMATDIGTSVGDAGLGRGLNFNWPCSLGDPKGAVDCLGSNILIAGPW